MTCIVNKFYFICLLGYAFNICADVSIAKTKKGVDIQKVMNYNIDHIIERFKEDYGVDEGTARKYEKELKRWFIVANETLPKSTDMFSRKIDDLWHTWLLFTKDYQKFCQDCFGKFIHHNPKIKKSI